MHDEQMVPLRKASGGCTVAGYHWAHDGEVVGVDYDTAMELLAIPGGGYSVAGEPDPELVKAPVTEPAPAAKAPVTEPAPAAKAPVTGTGTRPKGPARK